VVLRRPLQGEMLITQEDVTGQQLLGFTTHDLHRCQLSARAVALIYNGWSLFVRLASPEARREAITSRPWLMSSVGRRTERADLTTITLTALHAHFDKARRVLMQVSARLQTWAKAVAEQLRDGTVWDCVVTASSKLPRPSGRLYHPGCSVLAAATAGIRFTLNPAAEAVDA